MHLNCKNPRHQYHVVMERNLIDSPYQIPSCPEALYLRNYDDSFLEIIKHNAEQGGDSLQDRVNTFFKRLESLNYEFRIIDEILKGFGFERKENNPLEKVKKLIKMDSELRLDEFTRLVLIVIDNMKQNTWHTSEVPWTLYCQGNIEANSKRKLPISQNTRIFIGAKPGSIYERIVFDE